MDELLSVDEVRALYAKGDAAHDFDHVLRVMNLARRLAEDEGADMVVVRMSALLHDVPADHKLGGARSAHHLAAAAFARQLLESKGLGTEQVENVVHCIEAHRFRDQSIQPQTLEAKCLYDADKLDSIGAIGIGRAFAYAGAHGNRLWVEAANDVPELDDAPEDDDYTPVHEYVYKLARINDGLYTKTARRIGEDRDAFMKIYFAQLDTEMADKA